MSSTLAQRYHDFLVAEGYHPETTDNGHLVFKQEGGHYYLLIDEQDPQFFRLVFPNFHPIGGAVVRQRALAAAGRVAEGIKSAKIILVDDNAWACAEFFVVSVAHATKFFANAMAAVQAAVQRFEEELRER